MISQNNVEKINKAIEEFLTKMTLRDFSLEVGVNNVVEKNNGPDTAVVQITTNEPQMLIGQNGQTLFELERILRILLNKKLSKSVVGGTDEPENFYISVDVNGYKNKKVEYLKKIASDAAVEVLQTGQKKILPSMPAHERRIIHATLSGRQDIKTESQGEEKDRRIIISLK